MTVTKLKKTLALESNPQLLATLTIHPVSKAPSYFSMAYHFSKNQCH